MSAHRSRLVLTDKAKADLQNILRYSARQWGAQQRNVYRAKLTAAFERLRRFPNIGESAPHLAPSLRSLPVEQHVIYYLTDDQTITIIRILHSSMDALAHLP